jgi:hypothetical protein
MTGRAVLVAALLSTTWLVGCGATAPRGVVALSVSGVDFVGDVSTPAHWDGLGVWLSPGIMVTTAATAIRAQRISASVDGAVVDFSRVLAYDRARELVVFGTSQQTGAPGEFATAVAGQAVEVAGGLEPISAVIVGVSSDAFVVGAAPDGVGRRIVLDVDVPRGLLVVDRASRAIIGFTSGARTTRVATPAANPDGLLAGLGDGVPLAGFFTLEHASAWMDVAASRETCLRPGQALSMPFQGAPGGDLMVDIAPFDGQSPLATALVSGRAVAWKGVSDARRTLAFGRSSGLTADALSVLVVNVAKATSSRCATVRLGGVAWERGLK